MNKVFALFICWAGVIGAYIFMGFAMPAINSMISTASTELTASANMTNFPGTQTAVDSAPVWLWVIPGLVGIVITTITLKVKRPT